ncbi:RNA pseudouridine synthase [Roseomonas nepalensis]|uniref:RNA pseudouridine synthase n=1 Tax=Muricoccus nepalensis TaxID=1854500 RepID=A0A502FBZ4_9PROT|nr:RNA pseudouridine synthase [Roseomonas nepalensis]TPG46926.1 RNA pseudouridine synthase [Roseomonas nepalensis]
MRDPSSLPGWLAARVLHIRPDVLVIDKPAGLPIDPGRPPAATPTALAARPGRNAPGGGGNTPRGKGQPARGTKPSLADWLPLLQLGRRHPPQPVHRLDTDTAGCLVLGRTRPSLGLLGALFADRRAEKTYWAVVAGRPRTAAGTLDAPLRKVSTREAGWRMEAHPEGQPARTAWRLLGGAETGEGPLSWLELRPETGRTHQLRVHCALLGCPILGDPLYGAGRERGGPMHLLARAIALPLDPPLAAEAPVPPEMAAAFARCGAPLAATPPRLPLPPDPS